ncbi:hypothetical protein EJ05DRAFT_477477 [Pseudovirgaria hyperparasitica]|uniref:Pre-mRNA-splicing factor n=1 Tax=Pseudovirgaria hyperparasitica TaxID=470096 RepID=A0A6A6W514_9PEZI|nr:uncharacterized protein EJ05DRAFT_477477 [Pseudovirgaria hyperparasitica]KAF2757269.1 hypothetical protein EJ05DRAFT_477477 [Pseudovirgaria hyperparasitica]
MPSKPAPAKISLTFGTRKSEPFKSKVTSTTGAQRGHTTLDDFDHQDDGTIERTITSFSGGKAIHEKTRGTPEGLRIIALPPEWKEGNWLERKMKRQKGPSSSREQPVDTLRDVDNAEEIRYGLKIAPKKDTETLPDVGQASHEATVKAIHKTDEELALEALLEDTSASNRIISLAVNDREAFQQAYEEAPDMASIADYENTPIEGFGAALLRGMGWKDGESIGRKRDGPVVKPRVLERRPALLGIGAKPEDATGEELGAWGKTDKHRKGRQQTSYVPVLLKHKHTGEDITEQELKARREREKSVHNDDKEHRRAKRRSPSCIMTEFTDKRPERDDYHKSSKRRRGRNTDKDRDRYQYQYDDRTQGQDIDHKHSRSHCESRDRSTSTSRCHRRRRDNDNRDMYRSNKRKCRKDEGSDATTDRYEDCEREYNREAGYGRRDESKRYRGDQP